MLYYYYCYYRKELISHCIFRGQESAGIVTSFGGVDAKDLFSCRGHGLVSQVQRDYDLADMP